MSIPEIQAGMKKLGFKSPHFDPRRHRDRSTNWIERQARFIGARHGARDLGDGIVKERPGFGQRVVPAPGSVLASPVPAAYDPDPDYFFHWFRDAAVVDRRAARRLCGGVVGDEAVSRAFATSCASTSLCAGRTARRFSPRAISARGPSPPSAISAHGRGDRRSQRRRRFCRCARQSGWRARFHALVAPAA